MDYANALRILDIKDSSDKISLKKKYRQLMHMVHPDNTEFKSEAYPYDAATINAAYSFLCEYKEVHQDLEITRYMSLIKQERLSVIFHLRMTSFRSSLLHF